MMEHMFSIIIPVYNVQDYLEDCLCSVLTQSFKDYEILLINDGSTDDSGILCDSYEKKYERIKAVHQKNRGLSGARNTGLKMAAGKYIVLLDSDDVLCEGALMELSHFIIEQKMPDAIVSRRRCMDENRKNIKDCRYVFDTERLRKMSRVQQYEYIQTLPECWLGAWLFTVKRDSVLSNHLYFYEGILHEDEEWTPRAFFRVNSIAFFNGFVYCNRLNRNGSITSSHNIRREMDKCRIIGILLEEFSPASYSGDISRVIQQRTAKLLFGIVCGIYFYRLDKEYEVLCKAVTCYQYLLKSSNKMIHRLAFLMFGMIGIERTGYLLSHIKKAGKQ